MVEWGVEEFLVKGRGEEIEQRKIEEGMQCVVGEVEGSQRDLSDSLRFKVVKYGFLIFQ